VNGSLSSSKQTFVVAIDGPSASGKSSVGSRLASVLHFIFLDTGQLYRAVTYLACERGIAPSDDERLAYLVQGTRFQLSSEGGAGGSTRLLVDGRDIADLLRTPVVEASVAEVSSQSLMRSQLALVQRTLVRGPGTIVVGRDIGTALFPDAPIKIWLTASLEERALRRSRETRRSLTAVLDAMAARDTVDAARRTAPMSAAADSIVVSTDQLTVEEVTHVLADLVRARIRELSSESP